MSTYYITFTHSKGKETDVSRELEELFQSWLLEEALEQRLLTSTANSTGSTEWSQVTRKKLIQMKGKKGFLTPRSGSPKLGDEIILIGPNRIHSQFMNNRTCEFLALLNRDVVVVPRKLFNNLMTLELQPATQAVEESGGGDDSDLH